ncbi:hypothetical protein ACMD2_20405 [Ananas comosus]|uniref:Uncharacterized protein n=2 Tax=Ananas comosus TaxID=4615 RepID=A0A199W1H9_ANACO|nr:hypothetical protein ACMD2_20405 [Ananas comosus]
MSAVHFSALPYSRANLRLPRRLLPPLPPPRWRRNLRPRSAAASGDGGGGGGGDSYLDMWKKAVERRRRSEEFRQIADRSQFLGENGNEDDDEEMEGGESLDRQTQRFNRILEVPSEERDRIQRLQVIDRAAAAIAAARALLDEVPPNASSEEMASDAVGSGLDRLDRITNVPDELSYWPALQDNNSSASKHGTPGPDFWSWSPPPDDLTNLKPARKSNGQTYPSNLLMEKEKSLNSLPIPFESSLIENKGDTPLPPLQTLVEIDTLFSKHAAEATKALDKSNEASSPSSSCGVNLDGSRWWKETGVEKRSDGVICKWTLTRGVSADEAVEWEDKYWEAADRFDYKELGSEKSGRDAAGNVWREYWKESMWQDLGSGLAHIEKTADKWGKNGKGDEWHEKWWEHYDASGKAEKWAHKWCSIDPTTPLDAGHAHVWHERWGEKYDGRGSSMKYTDKWAERSEGWGGRSKWGDKWDEHFDCNAHGVKQGETWWEGTHGERWNRTWGERHNGSGWVHKYGQSSSGEHWDTHVGQETWYERFPHYGFDRCFENSVQLRAVRRPPFDDTA